MEVLFFDDFKESLYLMALQAQQVHTLLIGCHHPMATLHTVGYRHNSLPVL
jgi:hypothetical protein